MSSKVFLIPIRGLRQRSINAPRMSPSQSTFPNMEESNFSFEHEGSNFSFEHEEPEEKFKRAYGQKLYGTQPEIAEENKLNLETQRRKPMMNPHKFIKEFKNKFSFPKNNFTQRHENQELIDFFYSKTLNSKMSESDVTEENKNELLLERYTPFHNVEYKDQLNKKQKHAASIMKAMNSLFKLQFKERPSKWEDLKKCKLYSIRHPSLDKYGSTGFNNMTKLAISGTPPVVGYKIGQSNIVVSPNHLSSIKNSHKLVIQHLETFLSQPSHKIYTCHVDQVWTDFIIRSNEEGQILLSGIVDSRRVEKMFIDDIAAIFKKYFWGPGRECKLFSITLQYKYLEEDSTKPDIKIISGPGYLEETIGDKSFIIDSNLHFQTNTPAASVLYDTIAEMAGKNKHCTILDVGCGSGTTGIMLASRFKHIIGVDINKDFIDMANRNAKLNKLTNCTYFHGPIQKHLPEMHTDLSECKKVIAIINAPQYGISAAAISAIRTCPNLKKIIFVSWRPCSAIHNIELLMKDDRDIYFDDVPFVPTCMVPIDMNPHTIYTQLVILFERKKSFWHRPLPKWGSSKERKFKRAASIMLKR